jgi:hypothetical protein
MANGSPQINSSAIPVAGIGGLGMLAFAGVIAYAFPEARWLLALGLAAGTIFASALVVLHRRRSGRSSFLGR